MCVIINNSCWRVLIKSGKNSKTSKSRHIRDSVNKRRIATVQSYIVYDSYGEHNLNNFPSATNVTHTHTHGTKLNSSKKQNKSNRKLLHSCGQRINKTKKEHFIVNNGLTFQISTIPSSTIHTTRNTRTRAPKISTWEVDYLRSANFPNTLLMYLWRRMSSTYHGTHCLWNRLTTSEKAYFRSVHTWNK